jgi:hypothetical protein
MLRTLLIWAAMAVSYALFLGWFYGSGKPLTPAEIEMYLERLEVDRGRDPERLAATRRFLETDSGGEFYMVNLINLRDEPDQVGDVQPGETSQETLARYSSNHMAGALLRRAGYFVVVGAGAADNIEEWGLDHHPEWRRAGVVRYRSRRDLMEIATDPRFIDAVKYKVAAIEQTFAFPIDPAMVMVGPKHVAAALLVALGALLQLGSQAVVQRRRSRSAGDRSPRNATNLEPST